MGIDPRRGYRIAFVAFVLFLTAPPIFGQCFEHKLLVPDGLRKGQSISILPFSLLRVPGSAVVTPAAQYQRQWYEDEERKLQQSFAGDLTEKLKELAVFSEIRGHPANLDRQTNLVMEGSLTGINDTTDGIRVVVSALIKRTSDGAQVLRMTECGTTIRMNVDSSFLRGVPGLLESFLSNIATQIAKTVGTAAGQGIAQPRQVPIAPATPPAHDRPDPPSVEGVVSRLISDLQGSDWSVRDQAANKLAKYRDPRVVEALINTLSQDQHEHVRACAADSLRRIGDPRALEPLMAALKDKHYYPKSHAAEALGELKDPRAVEPLISALKEELKVSHNAARISIVQALGQIGDRRAIGPLNLALTNRSANSFEVKTIRDALQRIRETVQ